MNNNINKKKRNAANIKEDILKHLRHTVAKPSQTATELDWFNALAYTLNDYLTEHWMTTIDEYRKQNAKRVYYLSLEFLTGRFLVKNNLLRKS